MKGTQELLAFNRGRISRLGMARVDLKRTALSAAIQTNWMPRVLGSMMLRPGLGYINTEPGFTKTIPFVFASDDTAIIELHDETATFVVDDERVARAEVSATITNGTFVATVAPWLTFANPGTFVVGGGAQVVGAGVSAQSLVQYLTVGEPNTEHGVRVVVRSGTIEFLIADSGGPNEVYFNGQLGPGTYSIGFTPSGAVQVAVAFASFSNTPAIVDSVTIEEGDVELPTPWTSDDLQNVRSAQSGDLVFIADGAHQQRIISRIAPRSWSISLYAPIDGPFLVENTSDVTLTASAITGSITISASRNYFNEEQVGGLLRLTSVGQTVTEALTAANQFSDPIRVVGTGTARNFSIVITGTFTATVTLQYSVDETTWYDRATYTAATSTSLTDGLDNQIIYYRIGIKTGDYTSGTATATLSYAAGSITGVVRITDFGSASSLSAEVLTDLGGTTATEVWSEGAWSDYRGWPTAVAFHDGRLFWAGRDAFWGSVTDQFYTFDDGFEGDAGPIQRSIGYGPVDTVNWLLSLDRLLAGTAGAEIHCRSSSFNEPLTPTNFTPKNTSTQGSAMVAAVQVDDKGLFIQRNGRRLYELAYSGERDSYAPEDLMALVPEAGNPGITALAVQRKPDTRIHCRRTDGTVGVIVYDRTENVICWVDVETDGEVEDVCVLPGAEEDYVYYVVKRTIDGADVRYLEKWAFESECQGAAINKLADCFIYAAGADNVIDGLDHLEGEEVVAWGSKLNDAGVLTGYDLGAFTVASGSITLPDTYTNRCAGLYYEAQFKSTKLAYSMQGRSGLTLKKKIDRLGLILVDTHPDGLYYGVSFEKLDPLPETDRYGEIDLDAVWDEYDSQAVMFRGEWDTDARLCLEARAPRACTVLAAVVELETSTR
jgi:hypothetical protein